MRADHIDLPPRRTALLGAAALAVAALVALLVEAGAGHDVEANLLRAIHAHASHGLDRVMLAATDAARTTGLALLTTTTALALAARRRPVAALYVVATMLLAWGANVGLKQSFGRARPALWQSIAPEHTLSFPSGHAMTTAAYAAALNVICLHTRWRWPVLVATTAGSLVVGTSRAYLGVHWPTDIVAGWAAGAGVALLVAAALAAAQRSGSGTDVTR